MGEGGKGIDLYIQTERPDALKEDMCFVNLTNKLIIQFTK